MCTGHGLVLIPKVSGRVLRWHVSPGASVLFDGLFLRGLLHIRLPSPHQPHHQRHADRTGEHGECLDAARDAASQNGSQNGRHQQEEQGRCAAGCHQYQTFEAPMAHTTRHRGASAF